MNKTQRLIELLVGSDSVGESDSLAGLRRYNAAKRAVNGNRCGVTQKRLATIAQALKPYHVIVSAQGADIRVFNPHTKAEMLFMA